MSLVRLPTLQTRAGPHPGELFSALREAVRGEVRFDRQSRGLYSMDASNFRALPVGVVLPRDEEDTLAAIEVCRRLSVPLVSRGGGTSLSGQAVNAAVVLDHSKHCGSVLHVDAAQKLARVQPGCVLDDLREQTRPYHLTFGPDPSTHDRCTLGGMIGNNACGVHSVLSEFYGPGPRTEDNVQALDVATYDGLRLAVGRTSDEDYAAIQQAGGPAADIYRKLRDLASRYADVIRNGFPDIPRRVSGYNLPALLPENGFNVASALVGSEGTCATVLGATVRLCPALPHRVLLVLGYPDIGRAADDVPRVRESRPVGLEGMDRLLTEQMRRQHMHADHLELLPDGDGWLFVEFGGDTPEEAVERAHDCMRELERRSAPSPTCSLIRDPETQSHLWRIRKSGLGATAFAPGQGDAWPGWEDSAVPVDQVGDYLRELQGLYDKYGYTAALYGHFGQGCVHTRIDFDLTSQEGIARYRAFTLEAAELCVRLGGSLSGEHGDGQQRSDLLPVMFDREVLRAFEEFKRIWDPHRCMNPGRIVDPRPRDRDLRLGAEREPWHPETYFAYPEDHGDFAHTALRCVGVGLCRKTDSGTMCPSYMVTHEEAHSTRGRGHLLFEMVKGEEIRDGWASKEVREALDLCLSCKACKSECPVSVDMSKYKAEFLAHHYEHTRRPRQAYAFGWIHRWAPLGVAVSGLANFAAHAPGLSRVAKAVAGMAPEREIPRLASRTFRHWFQSRGARVQTGNASGRVVLWPDTFNNHFKPHTLQAATEVLERAGVEVMLPPERLCCGRPLYDFGMLDTGRQLFEKILSSLQEEIAAGTPVVGLEPSCVAALRDELLNLFPEDPRARALSEQTLTFAEFLERLDNYQPPRLEGLHALLQPHCQGNAIMGVDSDRSLLARMGIELDPLDAGCCGMAGAFGFEHGDKYRVSIAAGERVLLPAVRGAEQDTLVIADGFSCREQIEQLSERRALHLAEVVELAHQVEDRGLELGRPPEDVLIRQHDDRPGLTPGRAAAWLGLGLASGAGLLAALSELL